MRQKKIIWFAIVIASFIYATILYYLSRQWPAPGPFEKAFENQVVLILYGLSVLTFIFALFPRLGNPKQNAFIVSLALFESVAIYGFMAAFLARDWRLFIGPWVLALVGFMTRWPSTMPEDEQIPT
jgi:hypothetical protein